jgi:hypothetical protein
MSLLSLQFPQCAIIQVPFLPKMVPALALPTGSEVYVRRRGTTFVDSSMDRHWYAEPIPSIVLSVLPRDRYLVVVSDQNEITVLDRRQVWMSPSGQPHRLAPE